MFYINLGRWADSVIGPFDSASAAAEYIGRMAIEGARSYKTATVVRVMPPKPPRKVHKYELTHDEAVAVEKYIDNYRATREGEVAQ